MLKREGYQISDDELIKIQNIQMELIREVDRICQECQISYNMVGGTMLGAIRHKGYIPWDDDADIGFLRAEYERFREACRTKLDTQKFYFQDFRDTEGYRWGYGKLRRRGTEFLRLNQEDMPYEQGISIDIMPFDAIPDNYIRRKIHKFRCFLYRKIFWSRIGKKADSKKHNRVVYSVLDCISEKSIKRSYERFIKKSNKRITKEVRILTFPTPKKTDGYKREWYTDLQKYPFGSLLLPGARDYDGYLSVKYKDYMKLPPMEKRKVHEISKLTLPDEER